MNRSFLSGLCALLILLSSLPHGGALVVGPTTDGTLVYAQPFDFSGLSPFAAVPYGGSVWKSAVYGQLLHRESANNRNWSPDLVIDMPTISPDGLTFTFELKPNLRFSNADPLTTKDVELSFKMAITPEINKADYNKYVGFVDNNSLVVDSDTTFSITMLVHYSFVYSLMTFPIVSYNENQLQYTDCLNTGITCDFVNNGIVSNISDGPFMISIFSEDNITLTKNLSWYDAANVKTGTLIFIKMAGKLAAISALSDHSIDILSSYFDPGLNELKGISGIHETFISEPSSFEMAVNNNNPFFGTGMQIPLTLNEDPTNKTLGFENARLLRHAMSSIMDRATVVSQGQGGLAEPAATIMPSASLGWDPTINPDEFNVTVAHNIMTSLGFNYTLLGTPDSQGIYPKSFFNITVLAPITNSAGYSYALSYASELKKLGVGVVQTVSGSWIEINDRIFRSPVNPKSFAEGGYDVFFFERSWELDWNPGNMLSSDGSCTNGDCNNIYNFDLGENMTAVAQHIREYLSELDYDTRLQKVSLVQQDIAYYLPTIALYYPQAHWSFTDDVLGIDPLLIQINNQEWNLVSRTPFLTYGPEPSTNRRDIIIPLPFEAVLVSLMLLSYRKRVLKHNE